MQVHQTLYTSVYSDCVYYTLQVHPIRPSTLVYSDFVY